MESQRFDALARRLGQTRSRRGFLAATAAITSLPLLGRARSVVAAPVNAQAFDLTCQQTGTQFYCKANANDVTTCGPNSSACLCAQSKEGKSRCIAQPPGSCPTKRNKCRRDRDCGNDETCIRVPDCCRKNPSFGSCAPKCPA